MSDVFRDKDMNLVDLTASMPEFDPRRFRIYEDHLTYPAQESFALPARPFPSANTSQTDDEKSGVADFASPPCDQHPVPREFTPDSDRPSEDSLHPALDYGDEPSDYEMLVKHIDQGTGPFAPAEGMALDPAADQIGARGPPADEVPGQYYLDKDTGGLTLQPPFWTIEVWHDVEILEEYWHPERWALMYKIRSHDHWIGTLDYEPGYVYWFMANDVAPEIALAWERSDKFKRFVGLDKVPAHEPGDKLYDGPCCRMDSTPYAEDVDLM